MESIKNGGKASGGGAAKGASGGISMAKLLVEILVFIAGATWIIMMLKDGQYAFSALFAIIIGAGLIVFWFNKFYPHRYIFPGVASMIVFIIFPLIYTIYIAFTNYSDRNLFTLQRAEDFHLQKTYRISGGDYKFDVLEGGTKDTYKLVFTNGGVTESDGSVSPKHVYVSNPVKLLDKEVMKSGASRKQASNTVIHVEEVPEDFAYEACGLKCNMKFRDYLKAITVKLGNYDLSMADLHTFSAMKHKFKLVDSRLLGNGETKFGANLLVDQQNNKLFMPDMDHGYFRYVDDKTGEFVGDDVTPGFRVGVGFLQFKRIFTDPNIREPFIKIFIWTVFFAAGTVFITLAIGMVLACIVQWPFLKGRGIYRVILILPYAVPSFISILVFKGLFNEDFGEINQIIYYFTGWRPEWYSSAGYARSMLLLVNAWLGYPYMMILCMGLLKSISDDLYEASAMDGAGPVSNFRKITLPLLMKPLTPLLIASFAFNFNNFVLIMLLTNGGPDYLPEAGSTSTAMAGQTDLLVSYTYRLAFEGGAGGHDYGLASAIATTIFVLVGAMSVLNLKLTKQIKA